MTTINKRIITGADDGRASVEGTPANFNNSETSLLIGQISLISRQFFRFQDISIPKDSIINSVEFTVESDGARTDNVNVRVYANDEDNPSAPGNASGVAGLALTTANSGIWNFSSSSGIKTAPDITTVIQEIVDRAGWAPGNAIMIVTQTENTDNDYGYIYSYEGNSAKTANLIINFTPPGSSVPAVDLSSGYGYI